MFKSKNEALLGGFKNKLWNSNSTRTKDILTNEETDTLKIKLKTKYMRVYYLTSCLRTDHDQFYMHMCVIHVCVYLTRKHTNWKN